MLTGDGGSEVAIAPKAAGEVALSRSDRGAERDDDGDALARSARPPSHDGGPAVPRRTGSAAASWRPRPRQGGEHGQRVAVQVPVRGLEQHLPGLPVGHRPDQRGALPVRRRGRPKPSSGTSAAHATSMCSPARRRSPSLLSLIHSPCAGYLAGSRGRGSSTRPSLTGTSISNAMPSRIAAAAATAGQIAEIGRLIHCPGRPGSHAPSFRCAAGRAAWPRRPGRLPAPGKQPVARAEGVDLARRRVNLRGRPRPHHQQHQVLAELRPRATP